jgi:tetratricopeptide (TPR) repeat protein
LYNINTYIGNAMMQQEQYEEAINAYKEALRKNPNDEDTRYNLAYAQEKLKQQNKKDNKQQQQNQNKQQQQNQQQEQKQEQQEQQQPQEMMTQEEVQKMLRVLRNQEQQTRQKMQRSRQLSSMPRRYGKDW